MRVLASIGIAWLIAIAAFVGLWAWALKDRRREERAAEQRPMTPLRQRQLDAFLNATVEEQFAAPVIPPTVEPPGRGGLVPHAPAPANPDNKEGA